MRSPLYRGPGFALTFASSVITIFACLYFTYETKSPVISFPAIGLAVLFMMKATSDLIISQIFTRKPQKSD